MLLTLSTTLTPATDFGFLLHKNPARPQSVSTSVGQAHVFYPEATEQRCTAALLLEVDPIGLVRGKSGLSLDQYVNDRPYAASSLLAVALGKVFKTAMIGRCDARPELAASAIPLEINLPCVPSRGDAELAAQLFVPLGWRVEMEPIALDPAVPRWGDSPYVRLTLTGILRLADALNQLYVLLPVLDDSKHYWVGSDEIEKLLRAGDGWLAEHPQRELITARYLKHQRSLVTDAASLILESDGGAAVDPVPERATPLRRHRLDAVLAALRDVGASRVVDLGCGEGALLRELLADNRFSEIVGADVSAGALARAERALNLQTVSDHQRARITLLQSSVVYGDPRLSGYDALVLMEVVEHVDSERLPALERSVLGAAHPTCVIVTTPNSDFNVRYSLLQNGFRHPDHRFEFSRNEFARWAETVATTYGYRVTFHGIGAADAEVGSPTQMAIFTRITETEHVHG